MRGGKLVPKATAAPLGGFTAMSDIKPFVTQDGVEITSRSHLRAYEQTNGVKQVGNDFASQIRGMKERAGNGL
jgi:hypothetical protein